MGFDEIYINAPAQAVSLLAPPVGAETAVQRFVRVALAEVVAAQHPYKPCSELKTALAEWFNSQPVVSRHRRYSMVEIAATIETRTGHRYQTQAISVELEALGWESGRDWTCAGRNRRFWTPSI